MYIYIHINILWARSKVELVNIKPSLILIRVCGRSYATQYQKHTRIQAESYFIPTTLESSAIRLGLICTMALALRPTLCPIYLFSFFLRHLFTSLPLLARCRCSSLHCYAVAKSWIFHRWKNEAKMKLSAMKAYWTEGVSNFQNNNNNNDNNINSCIVLC